MDNQIKTSEAITIRYIPEDAQRLRAEAKAAGCSLSELIRERSLRADMEAELLKIFSLFSIVLSVEYVIPLSLARR